jgi:hypothetical protein
VIREIISNLPRGPGNHPHEYQRKPTLVTVPRNIKNIKLVKKKHPNRARLL